MNLFGLEALPVTMITKLHVKGAIRNIGSQPGRFQASILFFVWNREVKSPKNLFFTNIQRVHESQFFSVNLKEQQRADQKLTRA